jgi:hypothetical protein
MRNLEEAPRIFGAVWMGINSWGILCSSAGWCLAERDRLARRNGRNLRPGWVSDSAACIVPVTPSLVCRCLIGHDDPTKGP